MNKRTTIALLIAFAVILQSLTLKVNAESPFRVVQTYWGSTANPSEVAPGDRGVTLNIVIQNTDFRAYSEVHAMLYLVPPFHDITDGNVATGYYSGSIAVGQAATLSFQLNIDTDGSIGSYSLMMTLYYGRPQLGVELGIVLSVPVLLLGRVELETSISPSSLSPGSTNTGTLTVRNRGTGTASKVSVTLTAPTGVSIGDNNQWYFQALRPDEDKVFTLNIYVQSSIASSSLQIPATITYLDAYGTSRTSSQIVGLRIAPITYVPIVMTVKGNELQPGTLNIVAISILNNQTKPISYVQALLNPSSGQSGGATPLVIFSDNTWFFRSIDPFKSVTFNAQLLVSSNAVDSNFQLTLILSYLDPSNISRTENHVFGVRVRPTPQNIVIVTVDKYVLTSGLFNEPKITLFNSGTTTIRSITVTLSFPTAPGASTSASTIVLSSGNQWYFDALPANSNVTFSPRVFATLGSVDTSYQAQLSISYTGEYGISRSETKTLGFSVKGAISFQAFDSQVIPRATYPTGNVTITGNLLNMGNVRAMYTTLSIKSSSYFVPSSDGPIYIGEIPTNSPTPFTIALRVRSTTINGSYPITLVFNYQNDYGDKYSFETTLNVIVGSTIPTRPTPQPQQGGQHILVQVLPYVAVSIAAVSTVFLIRRRRKRRQK